MGPLTVSYRAAPDCRRARSQRAGGHFGEVLQGRLGPRGPIALMTLPSPEAARVVWRPAAGPLRPPRHPLGLLAAAGLRSGLAAARAPLRGGLLALETDMAPGAGCGASTATLLAAMRCAGPAAAAPGALAEARRLLRLEGAVDPLMLPAPGRWLWASRAARPLARLPRPPALWVVGGLSGPPRQTDPDDDRFADVSDLADAARRAARAGDARAFAATATASAARNQRFRPLPHFEAAARLAPRLGADGVVVAHTGAALGLLFAASDPGPRREAALALRDVGLLDVRRFRTPG